MRLGTVPASTEQTFTLGYVPEFVGIVVAAVADCESIVVNVGGRDIIVRLTGAQMFKQAQIMSFGALKATNVLWIPTADGLITGEQMNITVRAGAGGGVEVYVMSNNKGTVLMSTLTDQILANASQEYKKFSTLIVDNPTANDKYSLVSPDGVTQEVLAAELQSMAQFDFNNTADITLIDNTDQEVASAILYPDTARTVIIHRIVPSSLERLRQTAERLKRAGMPTDKTTIRKFLQ